MIELIVCPCRTNSAEKELEDHLVYMYLLTPADWPVESRANRHSHPSAVSPTQLSSLQKAVVQAVEMICSAIAEFDVLPKKFPAIHSNDAELHAMLQN